MMGASSPIWAIFSGSVSKERNWYYLVSGYRRSEPIAHSNARIEDFRAPTRSFHKHLENGLVDSLIDEAGCSWEFSHEFERRFRFGVGRLIGLLHGGATGRKQ